MSEKRNRNERNSNMVASILCRVLCAQRIDCAAPTGCYVRRADATRTRDRLHSFLFVVFYVLHSVALPLPSSLPLISRFFMLCFLSS